jgi:hypothetical protein
MSIKKILSIFALLVLSAFAFYSVFASADELTCKVEDVGGIPRIVLNGKPVRARMLYVSPLYFPQGSLIVRFTFPDVDVETFVEMPKLEKPVKNASIQIHKHGNFNCKIYSLQVVERDTKKVIYSLDTKGDKRVRTKKSQVEFKSENGRDYLAVKNLKGGGRIFFDGVDFEAGKIYHINIKIRGDKDYMFAMFASVNDELFEPKRRSFVGLQTKLAGDYDVDFITFPVQAADFMVEDGKSYNTENLKGALDEIVQANPDAKILVRVRCYPPEWWMKKYPEDTFRNPKGELFSTYKGAGSTFSQRFRDDCGKALEAIIDFCEKNYPKNIVGYHPGGANSCEWFYPDTRQRDWIGYEQSAQVSWRKWLTEKYKTDSALQKSWNDPTASLATATVPLPEEREQAFCLIDPKTQMKLFDCNAFRQDAMVDTMLHLSKIIRRKVPNKLSALFYGYTTITEQKGSANPGHFGLKRVLKSPDVDLLCGPLSYTKRDLGYGGMHPGTTESMVRAGKIWIVEDDIRTYRVPPTQQKVTPIGDELRTQEATLNVLRRDLAQEAIRDCGNWYMDLGGIGWYDDPAFWQLMKDFEKVDNDMIENPIPYAPEVALIMDERSVCYGGSKGTNLRTMMCSVKGRTDITDLAAPYGVYLLDDYLFGKPMSPKLAVFTVSCALDKKQRKALYEKTRNTGAIFMWTTGLLDPDKNDINLDYVQEATGFEVEYAGDNLYAQIIPTKLAKSFGFNRTWGTNKITKPMLSPKLKEGDIVLGHYPNGKPAMVLRGKHMFFGIGVSYQPLFDYMYKVAGVHQYSKQKVCVFANGAYLSITCTDDDKSLHDIVLNIPSDKDVFDALTNEKIGKAPNITLKMKRGDNRVLRLGKGNAEFRK